MKNTSKTVAYCGLLIAAGFVLNWLEFMIPMPLPAFKLGLANVVTLFALYRMGALKALAVLIGRCGLSALLFGSPVSLAFSLAGGLLALLVMLCLKNRKSLSVYGVSLAGATAHNVGQCAAAVVIMRTPAVFSYLLFLIPAGAAAGLLVALIYRFTERIKT